MGDNPFRLFSQQPLGPFRGLYSRRKVPWLLVQGSEGLFQSKLLEMNSTRFLNWLALPVGNEGINLYIGILGMKLPSFPTKGQVPKKGPLFVFKL